jgi:hypothetical protein
VVLGQVQEAIVNILEQSIELLTRSPKLFFQQLRVVLG